MVHPRWSLLSALLLTACADDGDDGDFDARLAALEAQSADDQAARAALQAEFEVLSGRLDDAEATLATLGAIDVSALQAEIDALDDDLAAAEATLATQGATLTSHADQLTSLGAESSALATDVAALVADVDAHDAGLESLGDDLQSVAADLDGLTNDLDTVESTLDGVSGDVAGLATDVAGLATDVEGVSTDLADVVADLADLGSPLVRRQTSPLTLDVPSTYSSIQAALDALDGLRLEAEATIRVAAGTHQATGIVLDHPDGQKIRIVGATGDRADVTLDANGSAFVVPPGGALGALESVTLQGVGAGTGLEVGQDGRAALDNVRINGFETAVDVLGGSARVSDTLVYGGTDGFRVTEAGALNLEDVQVDGLYLGTALLADEGAFVRAVRVDATDNAEGTAYTVDNGSVLTGSGIRATTATYCFWVDRGSLLSVLDLEADYCGSAFEVSNGSTAHATGVVVGHGQGGVYVRRGSSMTLEAESITGAITGIVASEGAYVALTGNAPADSVGLYEIMADRGSWVDAQDASGLASGDVLPRGTDYWGDSAVYLP